MGAQLSLNDGVVADGHALLVDAAVAALVDQLLHGLQVGVAPCNVRAHQLQHLQRCLVDAHERCIEDLAQAQQLQDLADLGGHAVDTTDADNQGQLGLGLHKEVTSCPSGALGVNHGLLCGGVLLDVSLGALEHALAALLGRGLLLLALTQRLGAELLTRRALLQHALRDKAAFEKICVQWEGNSEGRTGTATSLLENQKTRNM